MKRMKRKNGTLTCKTLHRLAGYWYNAVQMSGGKQRPVTICQRCASWYPRGAATPVENPVRIGGPHSA